jgi:carbon-monoxide dehydrogenase small subunit
VHKVAAIAKVAIELNVNDEVRNVTVRSADTLLTVLREQLGLTGAKPGCENGDCGACSILVNGVPFKSCIMLAIEATGQRVTTIECLQNSPMQRAFVANGAFQCGYCTSGFILNCHALVTHRPSATDKVIKEWLESNICRCTGYEEIEKAVKYVLSGI